MDRICGTAAQRKEVTTLIISKSKTCLAVQLRNIEIVDKIVLLGVTFNSKLNLDLPNHIDNVVKNASRRLFPLRILKPHLNPHELKTT